MEIIIKKEIGFEKYIYKKENIALSKTIFIEIINKMFKYFINQKVNKFTNDEVANIFYLKKVLTYKDMKCKKYFFIYSIYQLFNIILESEYYNVEKKDTL